MQIAEEPTAAAADAAETTTTETTTTTAPATEAPKETVVLPSPTTAAPATVETTTAPTSTTVPAPGRGSDATATTVAPTAEPAATATTTTDTTTTTTTPTSSTTTAPASKPEKKTSPGMRMVNWVQARMENFTTWASTKLPVNLPSLPSWCSLNCTWNKAKRAAYVARDRVHACAANTTECREDLEQMYASDALTSGMFICGLFTLFCWVASLVTGDLSQVDRMWSLLPPIYVLHFWSYDITDPRLAAMAVLSLAWGLRLSYNFYRKGAWALLGVIVWVGVVDGVL